jgi:hypothetical protein
MFTRLLLLSTLVAMMLSANPLSAAQLTPYPILPPGSSAPPGEPDDEPDDAGPTFEDGFSEGFDQGRQQGYSAGAEEAVALCRTDPSVCGIYLGSCLTAPQYGETEPNDNIVSADALLLDTPFWGQSYGLEDQDWYYVVTSAPNQTLLLNFSVPGGSLAGWNISIRDAAGNVFSQFQTDLVPAATSPEGDITYRATLGLVGTYYIAVRPRTLNFDAYQLTAILQDSPLATENFVVGFFDAETEPNNTPDESDLLSTGVSMFGIINLSFAPGTVVRDSDGDGYEFSQGVDEDWYAYPTLGNEIIALSVCDRAECSPGNWFFEVFNSAGASLILDGEYATPLLAVNSDTSTPDEFVLGLGEQDFYFLRVTHKRLLRAPCTGYTIDSDNNGLPDAGGAACGCETGTACAIDIPNPGNPTVNADGDQVFPVCPDGSGGGDVTQCSVGCICSSFGGTIEVPQNAITSQYNFSVRSTYLPPSTADSDAFLDFLKRPNPYAP